MFDLLWFVVSLIFPIRNGNIVIHSSTRQQFAFSTFSDLGIDALLRYRLIFSTRNQKYKGDVIMIYSFISIRKIIITLFNDEMCQIWWQYCIKPIVWLIDSFIRYLWNFFLVLCFRQFYLKLLFIMGLGSRKNI